MLKRPLRKATRARVVRTALCFQCGREVKIVRTALLLSVWQREVKIEGFHLQGVLRQCAAVTRCFEVGDVGEGSVTGLEVGGRDR